MEIAIPHNVVKPTVHPSTVSAVAVEPQPFASSATSATVASEISADIPPSPTVTVSLKSEIKVSGTRQMQVACEKCGHSYEYTLRREANGKCEAADQNLASHNAEAEAKARLQVLLEEGCDVVPCPKCGTITARMRR